MLPPKQHYRLVFQSWRGVTKEKQTNNPQAVQHHRLASPETADPPVSAHLSAWTVGRCHYVWLKNIT